MTGPRIPFAPASRLPDSAFEILSPAGHELRLFSACVEQLATGLQWAEGPVWFGDGRYLLVSDIPNDRICKAPFGLKHHVRWSAASNHLSQMTVRP